MTTFDPYKQEYLSPKKKGLRVYLSETTIEHLSQWQQINGITNRSKAIEGLVLMSIREARMLGISAILQETIRHTINHQYNRFAKLIVHAGLEAGAAKEAAQHIYWWVLLQEFGGYLDDLKTGEPPTHKGLNDIFSIDPQSEEGKLLIAFFNQRKGRFRQRAVKQLRRPLEELYDFIADMEREAAEEPHV